MAQNTKIKNKKERHKNVPASYLVLFRDNKVLLLKRMNTGYEDGNYSMIAGHVDAGETFTECIIREAKEEAGITLKQEDLRVVHVMHRDSGELENNERVDVFFTAEKWDGKIENKEPHKCGDLSWFELDSLPENTVPHVREVIQHIRDGRFYSEYGWKR